jgi:hypothetical protein
MKKIAGPPLVALLYGIAAFAQARGDRAISVEAPIEATSGAVGPFLTDAPNPSSSQGGSASSKDSGKLHIMWVPFYVWFPSLNGTVGAAGMSVPVSASFSDIFSNLNIGYMGAVDVRYDRIGILEDVYYAKLTTQEQSTPYGLLYSTVRTRTKAFMTEPDVYGRVFDSKAFTVDGIAGVRVWRVDNGLDFGAGRLPALSVDSTKVWADPLLGARFRANFKRELFVTLKGDAGIGPNRTWQVYAFGGKEFKQKYSVMAGYRRLQLYNAEGGFVFDAALSGGLLGFGIRFK